MQYNGYQLLYLSIPLNGDSNEHFFLDLSSGTMGFYLCFSEALCAE